MVGLLVYLTNRVRGEWFGAGRHPEPVTLDRLRPACGLGLEGTSKQAIDRCANGAILGSGQRFGDRIQVRVQVEGESHVSTMVQWCNGVKWRGSIGPPPPNLLDLRAFYSPVKNMVSIAPFRLHCPLSHNVN